MNDKNHIHFAQKILKICQLDERAACLANLPHFIRPKYYHHNIFMQPLSHLPDMLEATVHILTTLDEQKYDEQKRFIVILGIVASWWIDSILF